VAESGVEALSIAEHPDAADDRAVGVRARRERGPVHEFVFEDAEK
jgi:hypothetical protein